MVRSAVGLMSHVFSLSIATGLLTCMFTIWPSPFAPLTVAVTSTSVSLDTKFRMHLSYRALWPVCAWRSNFKAKENGRRVMNRRKLDDNCSRAMRNQ